MLVRMEINGRHRDLHLKLPVVKRAASQTLFRLQDSWYVHSHDGENFQTAVMEL